MTVKKYTAKVGNDDAVGQGLAPAVILYEATLEVHKKLEITHKRLFCPLAVPDFIKFKIYATVATTIVPSATDFIYTNGSYSKIT